LGKIFKTINGEHAFAKKNINSKESFMSKKFWLKTMLVTGAGLFAMSAHAVTATPKPTKAATATPTPTKSASATPTVTPTPTKAPSATATPVASSSTTGGFSTATGNAASARKFTAASHTEIQAILDKALLNDAGTKVAGGAYPVHITYTGNEDALIAQIVKDHTVDSSHNCPKAHWNEAYRKVEIKDFTAGVTIEGKNGSSANFGIVVSNSSNVVVRNMKIGALGGAANDADMFRIDGSKNVWIDHNEMFSVNNECNGSPEGDLTFESSIDIKKNSQNITVSYNFIHDSKKVGLDGHTQSNGTTDFQRTITYHHNYYKNVNARLPLQRGGWIHVYNNLYDGITDSGINVRAGGLALIEGNWFQNANNPVTCRNDTVGCGKWEVKNNNATSSADNTSYAIKWTSAGSGGVNADTWTSTTTFPRDKLTYTYTPASAQCVKNGLAAVAGVGKNYATLTCN
jgi:pectate lyase